MSSATTAPYDALLIVSFGGPEQPADVLPFLENVTRGRRVPHERLEQVAEHYYRFGGRSPINDQCRALVGAVEEDFAAHGLELPVYWGNRNWHPLLPDVVQQMRADGVRRAAAFVTSAYPSYSGCRQYRENLYDAVTSGAAEALAGPALDKLRHYYSHPGFVDAFVDTTREAIDRLPAGCRDDARLVFVTHSIPTSMATTAGPDGDAYVAAHRLVADRVTAAVNAGTGAEHAADLVYCSRSGPAHVPWLEPDVNDHLTTLHGRGVPAVVLVPIGFVSDHMEVVYDLDTEAAATASDLGLPFARAATPGLHPAFVGLVRDLVVERAAVERGEQPGRATVEEAFRLWDVCRAHCCPNPRGARPALCEAAPCEVAG